MSQKIQTKPMIRGHENESSWPSEFGTAQSGRYHWDPETKTFKPGSKPTGIKQYAKAPYVISDTINQPFRHAASGELIESRSQLKATDKACGTITSGEPLPPAPNRRAERKKLIDADRKAAQLKAVAAIDNGTAPLTEETRALCERQNEILSNALNFDAFNVAGRKSNGKGKRFRK